MSMVRVKAKLWLEGKSGVILGEGRAELLWKVKETGSLRKAATSMGMSYSHAWLEIKAISQAMGGSVVEASAGGKRGGGSRLTKVGESALKMFEDESKALEAHLDKRNR